MFKKKRLLDDSDYERFSKDDLIDSLSTSLYHEYSSDTTQVTVIEKAHSTIPVKEKTVRSSKKGKRQKKSERFVSKTDSLVNEPDISKPRGLVVSSIESSDLSLPNISMDVIIDDALEQRSSNHFISDSVSVEVDQTDVVEQDTVLTVTKQVPMIVEDDDSKMVIELDVVVEPVESTDVESLEKQPSLFKQLKNFFYSLYDRLFIQGLFGFLSKLLLMIKRMSVSFYMTMLVIFSYFFSVLKRMVQALVKGVTYPFRRSQAFFERFKRDENVLETESDIVESSDLSLVVDDLTVEDTTLISMQEEASVEMLESIVEDSSTDIYALLDDSLPDTYLDSEDIVRYKQEMEQLNLDNDDYVVKPLYKIEVTRRFSWMRFFAQFLMITSGLFFYAWSIGIFNPIEQLSTVEASSNIELPVTQTGEFYFLDDAVLRLDISEQQAQQIELNRMIDTSHPNASKGGSLVWKDVETPYIQGNGVGVAPISGGATWFGSGLVDDGKPTHFIGHTPGDYWWVFSVSIGDLITVNDGSGNSLQYRVVSITDTNDEGLDRQGNDVLLDLLSISGESINVQTCYDNEWNIVVHAVAVVE